MTKWNKITPAEMLSDLIKINTVNPPGNETAAAVYLKKIFDEAGIQSEIIEPEEGRGSLLARMGNGAENKKKLLYLSHTDVVATGEGWDFDPFSGEIKDGMVLGRGAMDCKHLLAAQACAMLNIKKENIPMDGELILAAVADEETGGKLGAGYLFKNHAHLIKADFAINEGAEKMVYVNNKPVYFIQIGEKGTAFSILRAKGVSYHGSAPRLGDNAVVKMSKAITTIAERESETRLIPEVMQLLKDLARIRDVKFSVDGNATGAELTRQVRRQVELFKMNKYFSELLLSMTEMTVSVNVVRGGKKVNVIPDLCEAELDIRIMPGEDRSYVEKQILSSIGEDFELDITEYKPATFSVTDNDFYRTIERNLKKIVGHDALCLPMITAGSTDSKYFRNAGIPAYGVDAMQRDFNQDIRLTIHGKNERIDIASLNQLTEYVQNIATDYLSLSDKR